MAEPSTPATIEEVAAAAGVSRSTVSRVVNGSPSVSAAAEERVRAAIAELKYVPNQLARSLASRQTKAIALVVPEDVSRFFGDPFIAAVVADVHRRLTESDYVLTMVLAGENTAERTIAYLRGGSVDGVIVVSHHSRDAFVDRIADVVPVVFGGRPTHKRTDAADYYVDADNVEGGRLATAHLIERGRRRIATIAGPADMPAGIDRLSGYRQALTDAGLAEGTVAFGDFSELGGEAAMREILAAGAPDAVFAASDLMAKGAVTVLREAGLRIPEDVAVIGFDDAPVATQMTPKLTTIRQPVFGDLVAQRLIELLAGERPPRASFVELKLVVRDSV